MVLSSSFCFELRVLTCQRQAYQKLARVIRPIAAVTMRESSQFAPHSDISQVIEKQEAWLERSHHWCELYRSLARALDLLRRVCSWSAIAS